MKMPGLTHRNCQFTNDNAVCPNGFWSKHRDEITFNHLQKFWSELSAQARQELLKIDKQTILEQARKNMYCSRCNGLLLEGFMQIVMYGKSSQPDGTGGLLFGRRYTGLKNQTDVVSNSAAGCHDGSQDPAAHPWGGLTTAKDGTLTVLSTYIYSKSLKGLQNVFDSSRARERERELLYPDACGGGGRGWISQGMPSYGRGHGIRETCALHTARLSCDTLVDFWSALGEETRYSLLRMKEEDFIERLMYRFDSKRFCRDCRKNVIREFKELKELKRMRKEPRCTHTFCAADSIFQYEVSDDAIRADWRQTFMDSAGTYHHFEWAVGTGEGKSDILEFENVGMNKFVNIDGLDLGGLSACYITLRAWKQDGRCTELSVKAHALKGQECVHSRLVVGDGFVSITRGESIRKFFELAEEAEEEEDDDMMDKDGNELDGECSRPQKHAKSPELAREFLLDAATVIFKEQVEKAFREGTARQNAHSIFVCLVIKLLEERVHVACKEIITLEKQTKLLEEEEKEKREEEERKERRRMKEREKKQRRKERLKEKDRYKDKEVNFSISVSVQHQEIKDELSSMDDEEIIIGIGRESSSELTTGRPPWPNIIEISSDRYLSSESRDHNHSVVADSGDYAFAQDECDYTTPSGDKFRKDETADSVSKSSDRRRPGHVSGNAHAFSKSEARVHINTFEAYSRSAKGLSRQFRANSPKAQPRNVAVKHGSEKFHCPNSKMGERCNYSCSCNYIPNYRMNVGSKVPTARSGWEENDDLKSDLTSHKINHFHNGAKTYQSDHLHDSSGRSHIKNIFGNNRGRDLLHTKMVWEPMDSHKKYPRRNSESDIVMISSSLKVEGSDRPKVHLPSITTCCFEAAGADSKTPSGKNSSVCHSNKDSENYNSFDSKMRNSDHSVSLLDKEVDLTRKVSSLDDSCDVAVGCDSNSENSYSNLSEGDSNLTSSNTQNLETTNSSDSEDGESENKEASLCLRSEFPSCEEQEMGKTSVLKSTESCKSDMPSSIQFEIGRLNHQINSPPKSTMNLEHVASSFLSSGSQAGLPPPPNQSLAFPMYHQAPSTMGYYHPSTIIWPTPPANGLIAMSGLNPYVVSSPLNYGWNGNPGFCMPFGGVSHLEPPLLGQGHVPIYHPVSKVNGMQPEEQIKISKPILAKEVSLQVHNKVNVVPASVRLEDTTNGRTVQKPDPPKAQIGKENNNGFSLFHFGGPVALSATLKGGKIEEFALNNSVAHAEADHVCSKKEATIEEYSLFAASNGFEFSF
uniref:Stress response protein NST1 n=1 Tax=Kalanchoe fedtschenkoi TaxID=63787 RepID=A0A7N1A360_KALFE